MKNNDHEVQTMTNKQTAALIEAIKIIQELASPEELKSALDRIQSTLEQPQ